MREFFKCELADRDTLKERAYLVLAFGAAVLFVAGLVAAIFGTISFFMSPTNQLPALYHWWAGIYWPVLAVVALKKLLCVR